MDEADEHPLRDELGLRVDDGLQEREVGVGGLGGVGIVPRDRVVRERPDELGAAVGRGELEGADAQVTRRDAREDGPGHPPIPVHRLPRRDDGERARRRDA